MHRRQRMYLRCHLVNGAHDAASQAIRRTGRSSDLTRFTRAGESARLLLLIVRTPHSPLGKVPGGFKDNEAHGLSLAYELAR